MTSPWAKIYAAKPLRVSILGRPRQEGRETESAKWKKRAERRRKYAFLLISSEFIPISATRTPMNKCTDCKFYFFNILNIFFFKYFIFHKIMCPSDCTYYVSRRKRIVTTKRIHLTNNRSRNLLRCNKINVMR